ncbi:PHP domain-containing protein [Oscillospiraceae bacterium 44-5]
MCKQFIKRVHSICRAQFKKKFPHRKPVERTELSCHTDFTLGEGILSPEEWINSAREAGVRAIAITDFQNIGGFMEAARVMEKLRRDAEPGELDFKVLYGLEAALEDGCLIHLLVQHQEGLAQLYRLLESRKERPFLRKSEINRHRAGLLVGCPGKDGEVYRGILTNLDDACLEEIAGFYDYLSVLPPQQYRLLSMREHMSRGEVLRAAEDLILKTIALGKRSGKPVAAAGNRRTANQDWGMFRSSMAYRALKDENLVLDPAFLGKWLGKPSAVAGNTPTGNQDWGMFRWGMTHYILKGEDLEISLPNHLYTEEDGAWDVSLPDLLYTDEMLDAFSFLGKESAEEAVIHAPNRLADLCEKIRIFPEDQRCFQPILPRAYQTVADLCRERLRIRYGSMIPETALERIEYELAILQNNEWFCSVLLIVRQLMQGLQGKGYPVCAIAGYYSDSGYTYSYAAYLLGVTEVDPLAIQIPRERFRMPDAPDWKFALNAPEECVEECWEEAVAILSRIFPQGMAVSMPESYQSNGRIFVPNAAELRNWLPLNKVDGEYWIPDGAVEDFPCLFRLYLVPAKDLSLLRKLEQSTGTPPSSINMEEDALPLLLRDQTDIPELEFSDIQAIWKLADPQTMDDIIKVFALRHSRGAWEDNGEELVKKKAVPFSEIIGSLDDVFCRLLDAGLDVTFVKQMLSDSLEELDKECISVLTQSGIPEWLINSCNKIIKLSPKAYCAAAFAIPALKAAWYKAHFPKEYAQAYSEWHSTCVERSEITITGGPV